MRVFLFKERGGEEEEFIFRKGRGRGKDVGKDGVGEEERFSFLILGMEGAWVWVKDGRGCRERK